MIRYVIEKELTEIALSRRFLILVAMSIALVGLSIYTGVDQYSANQRYYSVAKEQMRETVRNQVNWRALASWGEYRVYRPPSSLGFLVSGIENATGRNTPISSYDEPALTDSKYNELSILAIFGQLDLLLIIRIVFSLLALLFTYNTICGEREQGTLKLMLSNPIPRDQILIGKFIGSIIGVGLPFLVSILIVVLISLIHPQISLTTGEWIRLFGLFILCFLYMLCFLALGLFISTLHRNSTSSLLMGLVVWVLFVLVIPRAALMTAASIVDLPSSAEIQESREEITRQSYRTFSAWLEKYMRDHAIVSAKDIPTDVRTAKDQALAETRERAFGRINEEYNARQRNQEWLAHVLGRLSPAGCLSFGGMKLTDTGLARKRQFLTAAQDHQNEFRVWVQRKAREADAQPTDRNNRIRLDVADMPPFSMSQTPIDMIMAGVVFDFGTITLMTIACLLGAYVAFRKYDPR